MKLTILAATGGIGQHLLTQALDAGHDVTAVVRTPAKLGAHADRVRVVRADLSAPEPGALRSAVQGADAVLSGLGATSTAEAGVATLGTRAVIDAMAATGTRRIIVVSAAPIGTVPSPARPHPPKHDPGDGFLMRHLLAPMVSRVLRRHYADLAEMEDLLRASDLDWTITRPPQLKDKPLTGRYRTAFGQNIRGGLSIPRADVAHCMLAVINRPDTHRQVIGLAT